MQTRNNTAGRAFSTTAAQLQMKQLGKPARETSPVKDDIAAEDSRLKNISLTNERRYLRRENTILRNKMEELKGAQSQVNVQLQAAYMALQSQHAVACAQLTTLEMEKRALCEEKVQLQHQVATMAQGDRVPQLTLEVTLLREQLAFAQAQNLRLTRQLEYFNSQLEGSDLLDP